MSTTKPTLAFFGATGGCASAALTAALKDNYIATALARTPEKLRKILASTPHSVPSSTLNSALTILAGNVKSVEDVKKALVPPTSPTHLVDTIVFGVGALPRINYSLWKPFTLDDPHVCATGTATVLAALTSLADEGIRTTASGEKPVFVTISTTGVTDGKRDVPWLLYPLYHWALQVPHEDKKSMEQQLFGAAKDSKIRNFVVVRPTLLSGGAQGADKVRSGWEWGIRGVEGRGKEQGPALGWYVGKTDVGHWIFQEVIKKGGWEGKCATLTY
ncbi:uncharacterized protein BDZ99DRAFT_456958 [Mytilinidion resinicola]|uniref:NAD(P)-binding domain-containing protein n=1 Tax=Mytilinidion resinicola TaxID=574789 RepID=A0A6A6Z909_9PEZI|nr:uncharacterized protein BDZ99DRAFT_456958 [Mytilinidion resinicola]KAF2817199.1 hypothetical protein BDZ99DRAFT_456958 [Mytilinidion resinicola]